MLTCYDVADYFRSTQDVEAGHLLTHLKLQKLVFYAQAFHLAIFKEPFFVDEVEAWEHGPVVPVLYHEYKQFKRSHIPPLPPGARDDRFTPDQLALLEDVNVVYGQFSAMALRNMTHSEQPWIDAFEKGKSTVIPTDAMKDFYIRFVNDE